MKFIMILLQTWILAWSCNCVATNKNKGMDNLMPADIAYALVKDNKADANGLPSKFRTIASSKTAGSAQFSEASLKAALQKLPKNAKVILVDLRREAHGFVNGAAVSWYLPGNILNADRDAADALALENTLLNSIRAEPTVVLHDLHKNKNTSAPDVYYVPRPAVTVKLVESEAMLAKRLGLGYKRFLVKDRFAPEPATVDEYLAFLKTVPQDTWLYFHCRGGSGRTTTFMVLADIVKNADAIKELENSKINKTAQTTNAATGISLQNILASHAELGGKLLSELPKSKNTWYYESHKERANFISDFYAYVAAKDGFGKISWQQWVKQH